MLWKTCIFIELYYNYFNWKSLMSIYLCAASPFKAHLKSMEVFPVPSVSFGSALVKATQFIACPAPVMFCRLQLQLWAVSIFVPMSTVFNIQPYLLSKPVQVCITAEQTLQGSVHVSCTHYILQGLFALDTSESFAFFLTVLSSTSPSQTGKVCLG